MIILKLFIESFQMSALNMCDELGLIGILSLILIVPLEQSVTRIALTGCQRWHDSQ